MHRVRRLVRMLCARGVYAECATRRICEACQCSKGPKGLFGCAAVPRPVSDIDDDAWSGLG